MKAKAIRKIAIEFGLFENCLKSCIFVEITPQQLLNVDNQAAIDS
jgi:hypothetical protein